MPPTLLVRRLAVASVVANAGIVVTGGVVRLTGSGLGCPTWPSCTDGSLLPTAEYAQHGVIEFSNRMLTFVLTAVVLATLLAVLRSARRRPHPLALAAFLGIPAQAVLGGITVLTGLNPWTVAAHFLLSMGILAVTTTLAWRAYQPRRRRPARGQPEPGDAGAGAGRGDRRGARARHRGDRQRAARRRRERAAAPGSTRRRSASCTPTR